MPKARKKAATIPVPILLKKNDLVEVLSGREAGKTGKILKVLRDKNQIVVEKVNMIKRHSRPSPTTGQGGIIEREAPLHVSKLMLICPKCAKAGRFSVTTTADKKKSRVCRQCKELIDG
jgi:large subunit ribosomal protein L24